MGADERFAKVTKKKEAINTIVECDPLIDWVVCQISDSNRYGGGQRRNPNRDRRRQRHNNRSGYNDSVYNRGGGRRRRNDDVRVADDVKSAKSDERMCQLLQWRDRVFTPNDQNRTEQFMQHSHEFKLVSTPNQV